MRQTEKHRSTLMTVVHSSFSDLSGVGCYSHDTHKPELVLVRASILSYT